MTIQIIEHMQQVFDVFHVNVFDKFDLMYMHSILIILIEIHN